MNKIIKIAILLSALLALPMVAIGGRMAVDGISYFLPYYDMKAQDAKLLKLGDYRQSTTYTCGPAAIMNLLYYYNRLSSSQLTRSTEMRLAREMGTTQDGTSQSQVTSWLRDNGFSVYSGKMVTSQMIKTNIDQGIPTMLIFDKHWMLAKGYSNQHSDSDNDIIFADTEAGTTIIPDRYIDTMWARYQLSHRGKVGNPGYFIIAVPR